MLVDGPTSPNDIATSLRQPPGNVNYHFEELLDLELIVLVNAQAALRRTASRCYRLADPIATKRALFLARELAVENIASASGMSLQRG